MKIYIQRQDWTPHFNMRDSPMINANDYVMLMAPFEPQEILDCVNACARTKLQDQMDIPWISTVNAWK